MRPFRSTVGLFVLLISLAIIQSGRGEPFARTHAADSRELQLARLELNALYATFAKGEFLNTVNTGRRLLTTKEIMARPALQIRVSRAVGAAQVALGTYREALAVLIPAQQMAVQRSDGESIVSLSNSIAWTYLKMDNIAAASEFADQALTAQRSLPRYNVHIVTLRAFLFAKTHDFPRSDTLFSEAINNSLDAGDWASAADAWYLKGRGYAAASRNAEAELALTESFRLRKLHHLPDLDVSMRDLAEVLGERGDLRTGTVLMDEAIASMGGPKSTADTWGFLLDRGRLRMKKGDLRGALTDLRGALALARRLDVIPTDDDRVTFESGLAELYSLFIDCGNLLYLQDHDSKLKAEVFEAAEENRAASLRALVPQPNGWRMHLPPEHDKVLSQLQEAERELLTNPTHAAELEARQLRVSLDQIEVRAQTEGPSQEMPALQTARNALNADTAILSFHLGPNTSWLWVITQHAFDVYGLPPERELAETAGRYRSAIRAGSSSAALGDSLGATLLANLSQEAHRKRKWIVALDQELFSLPFSALRWRGSYVIEKHAVLLTPGVRLLKAAGAEPAFRGPLIAIGDAIYNRADPRWRKGKRLAFWRPFTQGSKNALQLPRLAGSGQEARSAVESWGSGTAFTGDAATKSNLLRISQEQPTILHLATHVIRAAGNDRAGMIVLGLNSRGEPELLDMRDIVQQSLHAQLVVMSGCASGDARALPASGLMGLTRAWLGSGVDDVMATRWPSLDDNGPLFSSFYRYLRTNPTRGAADALQKAELDMLHSHTFRANPEYWASYFLIGKV